MAIATVEHVERRARVLKALDGAVGLVLSGDVAQPLHGPWSADPYFTYLTGLRDEAGAGVLFDARAEDPRLACVLLLKPRNPEMEVWDGYRDPISLALRERLGFTSIKRTGELPRLLTQALRLRKRAACLHPFAVYDGPVSPDLALFRRVAERVPGVAIEDRTNLLRKMRAVKSEAEIALMRRAARVTHKGYARLLAMLAPGVGEQQVQRVLDEVFASQGGGHAYGPIVGSGLNGTVLHYKANRGPVGEGDLVVIDAGASVEGYACDVTRTFPASGRFTPDQRAVYEVVLRAQEAGIAAVRPGARLSDADRAARDAIEAAGFGDFYPHGIGHQLGLEVHDATPDDPLEPGMVVTIEPGVYLPDRALGVRIEDDILVTPAGGENLTASIPKSIEAIELAMRR
ncbi:MAG: aminopeptidase P family protein [Phycisphaerae bacterium]|nr:aminopeptidase P family protein [Phycisphaerae bacterium]